MTLLDERPLDEPEAAELMNRIHGRDERVSKDGFYKGYALLEDAILSFLS